MRTAPGNQDQALPLLQSLSEFPALLLCKPVQADVAHVFSNPDPVLYCCPFPASGKMFFPRSFT